MSSGPDAFVNITSPLQNASVGQSFTVSGSFGPTSGTLSIRTDDGSGTANGPVINGSNYSFQLSGVNGGTRTVTVTNNAGTDGTANASVTVKVATGN
jgi:hypothetical protein